MRIFRTIVLALIALLAVGAAVMVHLEGSLSSLLGYTAFQKGERLFPYDFQQMTEITWMRVESNHETAEFEQKSNGIWWMTKPWDDRMDPRAAAYIMQFTNSTVIVDALPMNNIVRHSMREFGVETSPVRLTLKKITPEGYTSTLARYTLGSQAPWMYHDAENDETYETTYMRSDFYGSNDRIIVGTGNILPLFKNGIRQLRDHRPLLIAPTTSQIPVQPREIGILHKKQRIHLTRDSLSDPWQLRSPVALPADQTQVVKLCNNLQLLTATRVDDPVEAQLPEVDQSELVRIIISTFASDEPVVLTLYPPDSAKATSVKATVSDRNAVFELPIHSNELLPGTESLPLSLDELRSSFLTRIDRVRLRGISIRSKNTDYPVIIRLREGDKNRSVAPAWLYSAEGGSWDDVNEEQLYELIKTFVSVPVSGFPSDAPDDLSIYGLRDPDYVVVMSYADPSEERPGLQTFYFGRGIDNSWYAMESGKPSVYQVGTDFLKVLRVDDLAWKPKKLFHFSRLNLRAMEMARRDESALALSYDYLDDSWAATIDGRDATSLINPNRARSYLAALEKMKVRVWLPYTDREAVEALRDPIFTLKLEFEEKVGEEKKLTVIQQPDQHTFTPLPVPQDDTVKRVITLQIAPAGEAGHTSYYYGRISTSPYFFMLDMDEVRVLGASVYEQ